MSVGVVCYVHSPGGGGEKLDGNSIFIYLHYVRYSMTLSSDQTIQQGVAS
jgi:hypothetical protein